MKKTFSIRPSLDKEPYLSDDVSAYEITIIEEHQNKHEIPSDFGKGDTTGATSGQKLLTLPMLATEFTYCFCGVRVAQSLVFCVVFCLSSLVFLSLFLFAIKFLVLLRFTTSDYLFDIFKLFMKKSH
jgi:hypothetical protein